MSKYKAAAYLRLSYTGDRSIESDSIANQRKLIEDFVSQHPEIELVSERIDDGYSGIVFVDCREHIQDYADWLAKQGKSASTIHTYLAGVCRVYEVPLDKVQKPKRVTSQIPAAGV